MANLETIVNRPQKKGFFRRVGNWVGTTLLTGSLLLGAYLPGCLGRGAEYVVPEETTTTTPDTTPPSNVSNFNATAGNTLVDLVWTNPGDSDFAGVLIRRKTSSYPANPTDGTFVYQGMGESHTNSGLTNGITYRYRIFSFDEVPNYSSGVSDSAQPYSGGGDAIGWIGDGSNGWKTSSGASWNSDYQSFTLPASIFVDSNGNIYVADKSNNRISKWSSAGNAIGWIGGGSNGWKTSSGASQGSDYQSFDSPVSVFIDGSGNIYAAEWNNHRVSKWNSSGNAIGWIGGGSNGWKTGSGASLGSDYQSFYLPTGVFVDGSGDIYVAEWANHRISKWSSAGNAIGWIGGGSNGWKTSSGASWGLDYQSFYCLTDVFVDNSGNIYVAESWNDRISKWSSAGNAIGWIGGGSNGWKTSNGASSSSGYKYFSDPAQIFVDNGGNIFIADQYNNRICKWNGSGNAIGWIGNGSDGWKTTSGASSGTDYKSFNYPAGLFVDTAGNIFIADDNNNRISKWKH